jgi:hypothetical protein
MANFDWDRLNKFMNEFIPFLVQQDVFKQQQQQYLQNAIQRYQAYGESQKDVLSQELMNKMWQKIMETAQTGAEEQPFPTHALVSTLKEQMPQQYTQGLQLPEDFEDTIFEAQKAAQEILIKLQLGQPVEPGDLMPMIKGYGYDTTKEAVKEYIDRAESEAERKMQEKQLEQAFRELEVRRGELGVRQQEAATKRMEVEQGKSGEPDREEMEKNLIDAQEDRFKLIQKIYSKDAFGNVMDKKGVQANLAKIINLNEDIKNLKNNLGAKTERDQRYMELAEYLKSRGVTRDMIVKFTLSPMELDENMQKLFSQLMTEGYLPPVILEYF